jgi:hypothetical protein
MAEVAGVTLGVAALVVSAVENFHKLTKVFENLKHYPKNFRKALDILVVQETLFRRANERLLRSFVDEDQARQMLANIDHEYWYDEEVAMKYATLLAEDLPGFRNAVVLVSDELSTVRLELQKFEIPQLESSKQVKKRLRWAFSHSKIEESLRALRDITQDFVSLTNLTTVSIQEPTIGGAKSTLAALERELNRFSKVKQTAEDLYLALGYACTVHTDHQAHLSLDPGYSDSNQILFTLAFNQSTIKNQSSVSKTPSKSTWLTIESTVTGKIEPVSMVASNFEGMKKPGEHILTHTGIAGALQESKTMGKFVRFQDEECTDAVSRAASRTSASPLENLCKGGNFCHQLSTFLSKSHPCTQAIGSFEMSRGSRHLIYIDSKHQALRESSTIPELRSLHQVLRSIVGDDSIVAIALVNRVRLAKQLARAVLHFQATAWLRDSWHSQKILVTRESPADCCPSSDPALNAYVTAKVSSLEDSQSVSNIAPNPLVVRNRLLFSLGIVLLELAFQKSIDELATAQDQIEATPEDVQYRTSDRLSKRLSQVMGPCYAEVVRKCINCDFAQGYDLTQDKLQEAFYRTVVCVLDKLERAL